MRIVFWQNMMAFHQSAHIRALAARPDCEVTWVVQEVIRAERAALGWRIPDPGAARVIEGPDAAQVRALATDRPDEAVHIFSGLRTHPEALTACMRTSATLGVLAEGQDPRGWKGWGRLLRSRVYWAHYGKRLSFMLAIGAGAPEWYRRCGWPVDRIYPYGYFMETPERCDSPQGPSDRPVRLLFVGQFIPRKGGDVLIKALAQVAGSDWACDLVGTGPKADAWNRLARRSGIGDRVRLVGPMPNAECMRLLCNADVLVLPSRFDGWGAVISEALMRGVPVICTDQCGAGALLSEPWRGEVVRAGSVPALREALERWIAKGPRTPESSRRIVEWSRCITGESAAAYLLAVVHHVRGEGPRPEVPW